MAVYRVNRHFVVYTMIKYYGGWVESEPDEWTWHPSLYDAKIAANDMNVMFLDYHRSFMEKSLANIGYLENYKQRSNWLLADFKDIDYLLECYCQTVKADHSSLFTIDNIEEYAMIKEITK